MPPDVRDAVIDYTTGLAELTGLPIKRIIRHTRPHSAIGYVTPADKLAGRAEAIHAARDRKLGEARERRAQARQAAREAA